MIKSAVIGVGILLVGNFVITKTVVDKAYNLGYKNGKKIGVFDGLLKALELQEKSKKDKEG